MSIEAVESSTDHALATDDVGEECRQSSIESLGNHVFKCGAYLFVSLRDRTYEIVDISGDWLVSGFSYAWQGVKAFFWDPLHPGEYGQHKFTAIQRCARVANMVFTLVVLVCSLPVMLCAALYRMARTKTYKTAFGDFPGNMCPNPKLLLFNPQMSTGTTPLAESGISYAQNRFGRLVSTIKQNEPDLVFLTVVSGFFAHRLTSQLKEDYRLFFTKIGSEVTGEYPSFFIAFRENLEKPPEYIPLKGGGYFFIMKTKETTYVCTYKSSYKDWQKILSHRFKDTNKVIVIGEINADDKKGWEEEFFSGIPEGVQTTTSIPYNHYHSTSKKRHTPLELVVYSKEKKAQAVVTPTYEPNDPAKALSDRHLVVFRS